MKIIYNESNNPYYNLAFEEVCTEKFNDVIIFWRNANSVIVGKNQNTIEEVNDNYVKEHDINVVRRNSGGGAVYHDLGNINFSLISSRDNFGNYSLFTAPIIDFLCGLGVECKLRGRNDLVINDSKISGNAQYIVRDKILHHGTLLVSADLTVLGQALNPSARKLSSKGIKSVRARVANINEFADIDTDAFYNAIKQKFSSNGVIELTAEDYDRVNALARDKYMTYAWNYGYSPEYNLCNELTFSKGHIQSRIIVKDGKIENVKFYGDFFQRNDIDILEKSLLGKYHDIYDLRDSLVNVGEFIDGITADEFIKLF